MISFVLTRHLLNICFSVSPQPTPPPSPPPPFGRHAPRFPQAPWTDSRDTDPDLDNWACHFQARLWASCLRGGRLPLPLHRTCDGASALHSGSAWMDERKRYWWKTRELQEIGWKARLFWLLEPTGSMSHTHLFPSPLRRPRSPIVFFINTWQP